jgi:enoyl-CoA hydratase/carnithine racemase
MAGTKVIHERRGAVSIVTLNRPEVHNAIDAETAAAISDALRRFRDDEGSRVLVVEGAGEKSFCSGADLRATGGLRSNPAFGEIGPLGFARFDPGKPTIAAVNGYCFAGGMELAAWCDIRIAANNAEFGVLNRRWGIGLIDGGTQRLPAIVGLGNALYLMETGVRIDARRALQMGFVQEIVPQGQAVERALELAGRIAGYPQLSVLADRRSALEGLGRPLEDGLRMEAVRGVPTLDHPDTAAALERYARGDRPEPPRG